MLKRDIQVRQHALFVHQRDDLIDMGVGIDIVQPHPHAERPQRLRQRQEAGFQVLPAPLGAAIAQITPVGAGVLGDHQQFAHASAHQLLGLAQHFIDRARSQQSAQCRNDAEATFVIAALADLQIRIVARREPDALRG